MNKISKQQIQKQNQHIDKPVGSKLAKLKIKQSFAFKINGTKQKKRKSFILLNFLIVGVSRL